MVGCHVAGWRMCPLMNIYYKPRPRHTQLRLTIHPCKGFHIEDGVEDERR